MALKEAIILHKLDDMVFTAETRIDQITFERIEGITITVGKFEWYHIPIYSFEKKLRKLYPQVKDDAFSAEQLRNAMVKYAQVLAMNN